MRKSLFFSFVLLFTVNLTLYADYDINSEENKRLIHIGQTNAPRPHLIDIDEPVAMYTVSTEVIDITFDANYYSQYTIYLSGPYAEMEYFVTTPTVYLPVSTMDEVIEIYIESDDCGSYYGILDRSASSGSME